MSITDSLEMKGAREGRGPFEAARDSLAAGCDLLLFALHDDTLRRARLELARALTEGVIPHGSIDAGRERLAAFDRAHPEPDAEALARPLAALTPPDWESRLAAIVERGLRVTGALPAGPYRVVAAAEEPGPDGPPLAAELAAEGLAAPPDGRSGADPAPEIVVHAGRKPLAGDALERLRARCRARPTALVGLQNDSFLGEVPEAAFTLSAADGTPLTRRVVARRLATLARDPRARAPEDGAPGIR